MNMTAVPYDDPDLDEHADELQTERSATDRRGAKFMWLFTIDQITAPTGAKEHARVQGLDYLDRKVDWQMPPDVYAALRAAGGAPGVRVKYDEKTGTFQRADGE